jgi:hypothetical protein
MFTLDIINKSTGNLYRLFYKDESISFSVILTEKKLTSLIGLLNYTRQI